MQNADDAGAKEVVFVSDEREFNITGGGLEGTQGERHCGHREKRDEALGGHWLVLGGTGGSGTGEGFWHVLGALRVLGGLSVTEGSFVGLELVGTLSVNDNSHSMSHFPPYPWMVLTTRPSSLGLQRCRDVAPGLDRDSAPRGVTQAAGSSQRGALRLGLHLCLPPHR